METINLNKILDREIISKTIKDIICSFELNKQNKSYKRGIYIYGTPGCGKTEFIVRLLNEMNYDVIKYDTGDIRNKNIIEILKKDNMSDKNIISLFHKKAKPIAVIMDEIDGMNNGDKGGINSLIKLIRPKKTKKQRVEDTTHIPLICISNYYADKKIKELMKVCNTYELKNPTNVQIKFILDKLLPSLDDTIKEYLLNYIKGDLRKVNEIYHLYKCNNSILQKELIHTIFNSKLYNNDVKNITATIIEKNQNLNDHLKLMNDTDRTIVGLLWHENIVDYIAKHDKKITVPLYLKVLDNICFADYIDRITFQKQIWQFNEMSSLIKTFHTNKIYHETIKSLNKGEHKQGEHKQGEHKQGEHQQGDPIRFTKVLTKYSTEYNNYLFIQELCQQLCIDKKDLFSLFIYFKKNNTEEEIITLLENYEIGKLDINRIYRYIDKYIHNDCMQLDDLHVDEDELIISTKLDNYEEDEIEL